MISNYAPLGDADSQAEMFEDEMLVNDQIKEEWETQEEKKAAPRLKIDSITAALSSHKE